MALRGIFRLPLVSALAILWACSAAEETPRVQLTRTDHQVEISIDGKPFTTFYFGTESPKPYLHPLRAPGGPGELRDGAFARGRAGC